MRVLSKVANRLIKPVAMRGLLAWERHESGVAYDPTSAEVRTDPYATYRRLRSTDPVHRMRLIDAWALTRYRDVEAVLRDHRRFGNADRIFVETIPLSLLDIEERRRAPQEDLVSALLDAEEEGDRLSHEEMLAVMLLILVAGNVRRRGNVLALSSTRSSAAIR